jgi:hypothetical protein
MRLVHDLGKLRDTATAKLLRLRRLGVFSLGTEQLEANRLLAYVTLEALNTWSMFSRYFLLSLSLTPRRTSGARVRIARGGIGGPRDVLALAMSLLKPYRPPSAAGTWARRDEPTWHEPRSLLVCASALRVSNLDVIQNALSVPTRVFADLPVFRNFFAHRNDSTCAKAVAIAVQYAIPTGHPTRILQTRPFSRPWPLVVEWIDDLTVVTELVCE